MNIKIFQIIFFYYMNIEKECEKNTIITTSNHELVVELFYVKNIKLHE